MMFALWKRCAVLVAVLAVLGIPAQVARAGDDPPVIDIPSADPEMAAAIAKARATLPVFWASYAAPKPSEDGHALKVRFPTSLTNAEHIWMVDVKRLPNGGFSGRFSNAPLRLAGQARGRLGSVHGGRHHGLDVHAQRQDRRL